MRAISRKAAALPDTDPNREVLATREREAFLTVKKQWNQRDRLWKFSDGQAQFNAAVLDEGFMNGIVNGTEKIGAKDTLRCLIRQTQYRDAAGDLHAEIAVIKVIEHLDAPDLPPALPMGVAPHPPALPPAQSN